MLYNTFNHHTDPSGFVKSISTYGVFSSLFLLGANYFFYLLMVFDIFLTILYIRIMKYFQLSFRPFHRKNLFLKNKLI